MDEPIARWNKSRQCWEREQMDLLSGQPDVWSETWPASGMTVAGQLYELPTPEPPQRARFFLIGYPDGQPWDVRRPATPGQTPSRRPHGEPAGPSDSVPALIPTPTASDHKAGRHHDGTGHSLTQAVQLLPTPKAGDGIMGLPRTSGRPPEKSTHLATRLEYTDYGTYAPAIARWEKVTGRAAPPPSTPSRRPGGKPQLSARFVEWLMGLPDGHVTGPDLALPREHQLRLLGNGVVPQQAALAVRQLTQTVRKFDR